MTLDFKTIPWYGWLAIVLTTLLVLYTIYQCGIISGLKSKTINP
ncbi:MAG: hypothetical protein UU06_C0022G0001 [Parcubacteria group bacterium GW2011_GWB1_40_5]|nr:MAG: hypothetical protein UU06_C0022G0001 [Parcubacteria group bacterium GW2011_GWB1_40_5]